MKRIIILYLLLITYCFPQAQTPKTYTSSEILLQLKKLNVLGSVLYIAAHPDDENTRLLAYLANEKMYRTGYLSLTRGDGGQNLIGDEQGIDLGLIRTQELLAARRIDGAEQFFSRAYDFGFCKSPEEALATWGHDKILSDVVWVVRQFKPDVIIARFPEDSRAGHGHHAASGILAREAFDAAADPTKFPEQLMQGVTVWQAKRMLWNTFNFGSTNTQNENQFKIDVGMYNPLLGKSYGEIAALSRSQHRSQGFGVPAQRGTMLEYFETIKGDKPVIDLFDGVDASWQRVNQKNIEDSIAAIISRYDLQKPVASLKSLVGLYNAINKLDDSYWKNQKLKELQNAIENCGGLFMEATANAQYVSQGDSLKITFTINNRQGINATDANAEFYEGNYKLGELKKNTNISSSSTIFIPWLANSAQPYWLEKKMDKGSFVVDDQKKIGKAENDPLTVTFKVTVENIHFNFNKPLRYKFTDPVKGEIYQPVSLIPYVEIKPEKDLYLLSKNENLSVMAKVSGNVTDTGAFAIGAMLSDFGPGLMERGESNRIDFHGIEKGKTRNIEIMKIGFQEQGEAIKRIGAGIKNLHADKIDVFSSGHIINYDHIPAIYYQKPFEAKVIQLGLKIEGRSIGYIAGAGDKVPQALEAAGYNITMLRETDITAPNLKKFDAVITGVRAYNTNDWMSNVYDALMEYVNEGGVLLTQYNTSNFISSIKSKIGPYPFSISRNRVTDETAKVNFLLPNHPALNYPNKITEKDFEGWVQERSIYHAEKIDSNYQRIISMHDAGEKDDDGSLIIANYGKGKFVYTGLVFFRELPAGVPGAYRLFANLIAKNEVVRMGNTWQLPPDKSSAKKVTEKKKGKPHN